MEIINKSEGFSVSLKRWLFSLGPGIITAALVFGPSKITIASKLGAEYGFSLLWIVVVAIFFMIIFTSMAARIGIATEVSLLASIREKWGRAISIAVGLGVFLVTASFQAGNSIGIGIALGEMGGSSPVQWIIICNIIGISLLFFRSFYGVLVKIMIGLIILMLFAFLSTMFMVKPSIGEIAGGLVPSVPLGSTSLVIAFVASCFSIVGAFYQSYLVQERKRIHPEVKQSSKDSVTGMLILGIMASVVMICGATVLFPAGIKINNAADMAKALEPLFGRYASTVFLWGLFGASSSALIGNASAGGTLLGDALGYGSRLSSGYTRALIALVMIIGATIAIVFGKLPIELIVLAQTVTILIVPFIGIAMYAIANDEKIMGPLKNTVTVKLAGGLGLLVLLVLAVQGAKDLFF